MSRGSNPFAGPLSSPPLSTPGVGEHFYDAPIPALTPMPPEADVGVDALPAGAAARASRDVVGADDVAAGQPLLQHRAPYMREESAQSSATLAGSGHRDSGYGAVGDEKYDSGTALNEVGKEGMHSPSGYPLRPLPQARNKKWIALGTLAILAVLLAIAIPVVRTQMQALLCSGTRSAQGIVVHNNSVKGNFGTAGQADSTPTNGGHGGNQPASNAPNAPPTAPTTINGIVFQGLDKGADGSTVTAFNGTTFPYINKFGGTWSAIPFDNSARAQDDVPPLSQPWDYTKNAIRGVNIGGWLNTEPFICSDIYGRFVGTQVIDEWTLSQALDAIGPDEKKRTFEAHYSTFITEQDFAIIAGAGLNWVRIPVPFWMIETYQGEPYYTGQWPYFLKAIEWARKYGIRINLDLHAMPGSQNGWDHSGRRTGTPHFLYGPMGLANAQRGLNYIRILTQFITQPQYAFGIINEPNSQILGVAVVESLCVSYTYSVKPANHSSYAEAYRIVRGITGYGKGPAITIFDGFQGFTAWQNLLPGADRLSMDYHRYFIFSGGANNDSFPTNYGKACGQSDLFRQSTGSGGFGPAIGGEWSLAVNDCGQYINGFGAGNRYEGTFDGQAKFGDCYEWDAWWDWTPARKQGFQNLALSWMDAIQHNFFWTWKIRANASGITPNPMWSYSLGLQAGFMPTDIRKFTGSCQSLGAAGGAAPITAAFTPAQTGGPGGQALADAAIQPDWPPAIQNVNSAFTYAREEAIFSLPVSSPTIFPSGYVGPTSVDPGTGWANPSDTSPLYTPAPGINYAGAWGQEGENILKRAEQTPPPRPRHVKRVR